MNRKTILLVVFGFIGILPVKAQIIVGGNNLNKLDIQYIELIGFNRSGAEASIWLDYGVYNDLSKSSEFLKPVNDKEKVRFRSLIDALNYFHKNDWELVQAYAVGELQHYVLQRKNRISK